MAAFLTDLCGKIDLAPPQAASEQERNHRGITLIPESLQIETCQQLFSVLSS